MEVKFQQMLEQMNLTLEQVSKGIQGDIKLFDDSWNEYAEAFEEYKTCTDPQEKVVLMDELNVFEQDLQEMDNAICKKIQLWEKNKDIYAAKLQKMAEGREKKKAAQNGQTANQDVAVAEPPHVEPEVALSGTVVDAQGGMVNEGANQAVFTDPMHQENFDTPPSKKEESNGIGWWILGAGIAILTLGVGAKFLKK